jgi:catechol 2,3-dioxygenase-like lactoylglutathione lyase family enzyme
MQVKKLDHLVLTVRDISQTCEFYARILGMEIIRFGEERLALGFGSQKINLHELGKEFEPKAAQPLPGSADLCFVTDTPIAEVLSHLDAFRVPVVTGPVVRNGALGPLLSVYFRDPDGNILEVSNQVSGE